jgi:hypothetical protein
MSDLCSIRWLLATAVFALPVFALPAWGQTQAQEHHISAPISFFDDAEVMTPGMLNVSNDFSYDSADAGHDTAYPGVSATLGLTKQLTFVASTGYDQSEFEQDSVNGVSDTYVGLKIVLRPEKKRWPAVAVKPSLEVLGDPSIHDNPLAPSRANFLIPVMVQKSFDLWRVYYTGGYLTRGVVFHSLAWEWNQWSHVTPTVVLSYGRLVTEQDFLSELGLNRSRPDILVGAGVVLTPNWGFYGNLSRSFGRRDQNSIRYQISAGISYTFRVWGNP